jgi:hypothetical protein
MAHKTVSLIHVPRPEYYGAGIAKTFIMIMPVGLLGLADTLSRDGRDVEVVHAGLAALRDPAFKLSQYLTDRRPSLIGFSLHWHHQLYGVLEEARLAREALPDSKIVLGGFTASYFANNLLERFGFIDCIVSGDGEEPLRRLAAGEPMQGIPNLTFRDAGAVRSNPIGYVAGSKELDAMEFAGFHLLKDADLYSCKWQLGGKEAPEQYAAQKIFYMCGGRGCSVDCSFCGGSNNAHRHLTGRSAPVFRSVERLLGDIEKAAAAGYGTMYMCFDPPGGPDGHYVRLFHMVAERKLDVSMIFECYTLPDEGFLDAFAAAFRRDGSAIVLSPDAVDEGERRRHKGYWYSNADLEKCLAACKARGISTQLYFTLFPSPAWSTEVERLKRIQERLGTDYGCTFITRPIEVEPGSYWQHDPVRYGLRPGPYDLDYFISRHRRVATPPGDPRVAAGVDLPGY